MYVKDRYKRSFDLVVLVLAHILFSPFLLILWILIPFSIWLEDRGAIFYTQVRLGKHGKGFRIFKFRTMVMNAEKLTGPVWADDSDERITTVGRVLRRFKLDELPQVLNIIAGTMSLVGPRPERPELEERFSNEHPAFRNRLLIRPGLAGLAQVRGDYNTYPRMKLRYDNLYIRTMSPWLDIKILFLSVWVVFKASLRRKTEICDDIHRD